jgi:hypothetical protein
MVVYLADPATRGASRATTVFWSSSATYRWKPSDVAENPSFPTEKMMPYPREL